MSKSKRGRLRGEAVAGLVRCQCAAAADQRGWDALVREVGGLISMVARAYRLSDDDPADVAQASWLKLFEHVGDVRDPARIGGWLATTTCRECLRVLRDGGRYVPFGDDAPKRESPGPPRSSGWLSWSAPAFCRAGFSGCASAVSCRCGRWWPILARRMSTLRLRWGCRWGVSVRRGRGRSGGCDGRSSRVRTPAVANGLVSGARDVRSVW